MNKLNITVRATENDGEWEVVEGLVYKGIHVNPGQLTDGLSIPWRLQGIVSKGGLGFVPGIIHDTSYLHGLFDRKKCDELILEALIDNGVTKWKRLTLYYAVRLFGGFAYDRSK